MITTAIIVVVAVALVAAGLHILVQRSFKSDVLSRHNDVAGFLLSVVGVIYAVVLGFVVVVAWEKYDGAQTDVDEEIAAVVDAYHAVAALPPAVRNTVRANLRQYAHEVVTLEWPAMARGELALEASTVLEQTAFAVEHYQPTTMAMSNMQQAAQGDVRRIFDARRQRIRQNTPSVPPILWFALISGAIATLGFAYLFGVENRIAQVVMTSIVAAVVTIMFIVIFTFDYPFRGPGAIQPSGWLYVDQRILAIDQAGW